VGTAFRYQGFCILTQYDWNSNEAGKRCMLTGNEAAARGALEAGVRLVASYPGSPSVQILECLAAVSRERGIYAEWSINEKVALEVAAAGSFAGLRSLAVMKADGLNVAMDFLTTLPLSGIREGLVIIVSDDPGAHSSIKEEDSRYLAPPAHIPLLEPDSPQDAKEMISRVFDLSGRIGLPVIVRLVTRICHARATVTLGHLDISQGLPEFPGDVNFITAARFHQGAHDRIDRIEEEFNTSPFNIYSGPARPELTVFTSGVSHVYALEAIERLGVEAKVGVFKVGTVWPLPEEPVLKHLKQAQRVLFLEEIEPFLEDQTKILAAQHWDAIQPLAFLGKRSGDVPWVMKARGMGEMDPDIATGVLAAALDMKFTPHGASLREKAGRMSKLDLPQRRPSLCAGCPHRASYWAIRTALTLDGRGGFTAGDIGCYSLGVLPSGYETLRTIHSMGSGAGVASGFGALGRLGFRQPVVAVIGDSTLYHAGIAPLINAKNTGANFLCVVLDNDTTAMTGHQPHPGSGLNAEGETVTGVPMERMFEGLGLDVTVADPYRIADTIETILKLLSLGKLHVLILRRSCTLKAGIQREYTRVYVDPEKCIGDDCGCGRLCSRIFSCPGNIWDQKSGKASIDEVVCVSCGVCAQICPQGAIVAERGI
jgi:indolepyruvate ferredoxin oxidoreductase alpha subunit